MKTLPMKVYFAYGSNLCLPRFLTRVPSARFCITAKMKDHRLVFNKRSKDASAKANLKPEAGSSVYGALFYFDSKDLPALEKAEHGYEKRECTVTSLEGESKALTFIAPPKSCAENLKPYDWYLDLICNGGRRFGLPEFYMERLAAVETIRDERPEAMEERGFLR